MRCKCGKEINPCSPFADCHECRQSPTTCPTCGSAVRVVGETTKHFEPIDIEELLAAARREARLSAVEEAYQIWSEESENDMRKWFDNELTKALTGEGE